MNKPSNDRNRISDRYSALDILDLEPDILKQILASVIKKRRASIPLSIFDNKTFSLNEVIIKFLIEDRRMDYQWIADATGRSYKTIWQIYRNACKRSKQSLSYDHEDELGIPILILKSRLSTLECVVSHLKDTYGMSFKEIAKRLRRDYQTVWTAYRRAQEK